MPKAITTKRIRYFDTNLNLWKELPKGSLVSITKTGGAKFDRGEAIDILPNEYNIVNAIKTRTVHVTSLSLDKLRALRDAGFLVVFKGVA